MVHPRGSGSRGDWAWGDRLSMPFRTGKQYMCNPYVCVWGRGLQSRPNLSTFGRVTVRGGTIIGRSIVRLQIAPRDVVITLFAPSLLRSPHDETNQHAKPGDENVACVACGREETERKACLRTPALAAQHVDSIAARPDAGDRPLLSLKFGIIQGDRVS